MDDITRNAIESGEFLTESVELYPFNGDPEIFARAASNRLEDLIIGADKGTPEQIERHALNVAVLRVMKARGDF